MVGHRLVLVGVKAATAVARLHRQVAPTDAELVRPPPPLRRLLAETHHTPTQQQQAAERGSHQQQVGRQGTPHYYCHRPRLSAKLRTSSTVWACPPVAESSTPNTAQRAAKDWEGRRKVGGKQMAVSGMCVSWQIPCQVGHPVVCGRGRSGGLPELASTQSVADGSKARCASGGRAVCVRVRHKRAQISACTRTTNARGGAVQALRSSGAHRQGAGTRLHID